MRLHTFVLLAITLFALGACAFTPQRATLQPTLSIPQANIGQGKAVSVQVVDERPSQSLGRRGSVRGAEITTDQNIAELIVDSVRHGMTQVGFTPVPYDAAQARALRIEVRQLEYSTSTGFWTGGVHTNAALKATATNQGVTYENFYRAGSEQRVVAVPGASANEQLLNQALSSVLDKLFQDQALLSFLAK